MSLRPKLRYHRMTVHVRGDAASVADAGRSAGGLLWRIRGPVANEPRAEAEARDRSLTLHALAWLPVIGAVVYLARLCFPADSLALVLVAVGVAAILALGHLARYLLGRPFRWSPVGHGLVLTAVLVLVMGLAGGPTRALLFLLTPALLGASLAARRIAREHARWLAEDLDLSWEERDERAARADALPYLPARLVAAYGIALAVHLASLRTATPQGAGAHALLALLIAPWALPWFLGRPIAPSAGRAWRALVLWLTYNQHEWYGPQTFQFDPPCRRPRARRVHLWGFTLLLATACAGAVADPETGAAVDRILLPWLEPSTPPTHDPPARASGEAEIAPSAAERAYLAQLRTEQERDRYLRSLRARRAAERRFADRLRQAAEAAGGATLTTRFMGFLCAVIGPPLLMFTAVAAMADDAAGGGNGET